MSKRRINKQQTDRIKKIQQNYQDTLESAHDNLADGLVISRFGKHALVEDKQGTRIHCSIRPNLDTLVAGDRVIWQQEGINQGVVVSLYPRASMLAKPTSTGLKKPVAANITQIIIVIAAQPEVSWPLLDSYLIMAETLSLHAVILLNKIDLPITEIKQELIEVYQPLAYPIIYTTKTKPNTYQELKKVLDHQVSVFVGQSGVGKSSLIAGLLPHEEEIVTADISKASQLGRHTTSNSRYYHLPSGGALVDSPGVREFNLWHIDVALLAKGYKEFVPYLSQCKFRNCLHRDTPECGLLEALKNGLITQKRYLNFIKLCDQFATNKK